MVVYLVTRRLSDVIHIIKEICNWKAREVFSIKRTTTGSSLRPSFASPA